MQRIAGKFVWFEHVSNDQASAQKFYNALFGWSSVGMPIGDSTYTMVQKGDIGIAGYRTAEAGMPSHWIGYLSVDNVDAAVAKAASAGAKVLMPPTDFPGVGRGAALLDPQGAAFCVWTMNGDDPADLNPVPSGHFVWNELMTSDAPAATRFYTGVFGYAAETVPMPDMEYTLLKVGDVPRAGLMKCPSSEVPPNWMPYVAVDDVDATAARVAGLGGQLAVPATDIPNVGRFACLMDPQGAALGIIRFNA